MKYAEAKAAWGLTKHERLRVRLRKCGKGGCTKCPHGYYAYRITIDNYRLREFYLGRCFADGTPRQEKLKK